jgi:hypothetical protein
LYFLGLVESLEERKSILRDILDKAQMVADQLDALNEQLSRLEIPPAYQEIARFQLKTLDYGRKNFAFSKAWFQSVLDELENPRPAKGS